MLFASEYRGFVEPARVRRLDDARLELRSIGGRTVVLPFVDLEVARLFDGARDTAAIVAEARSRLALTVDPLRLEGLVSDLANAGLMRPGRLEPLPVPPHTDAEARVLGWRDTPRAIRDLPGGHVLPPSTVAGARNAPAYLGSVLGLVSGRRGQPNRLLVRFPAEPFVAVGRLLIGPLANRVAGIAFACVFVACLFAVASHRAAWVLGGYALVRGWGWIGPVASAVVLLDLAGAAARAAAVARYTPGEIRVGLVRAGALSIPRAFVDTAGAAEQADRATRLRIIGAGIVAPATLVVVAIVAWFCFVSTLPMAAGVAIAVACVGVVSLILRLNPIANHEGHYLLAHALGHPDLRTQGWSALYGADRPWPSARATLSRGTLRGFAVFTMVYLVASLVVMFVFLGDWLSHRFGGLGFLAFTGAIALTAIDRWRRADNSHDTLGRPKTTWWKPTRRAWIAAAVAVVVALIPYHVEPAGPFVVLPATRADIVAQSAGDVRRVEAVEGQWVEAGEAIVTIDDAAARTALASAQARVDALSSELALLEKGARPEEVALARQRTETARTRMRAADGDAQRIAVAWKGGGATAAERDRTQGLADVARGAWLDTRRNLQLVAGAPRPERVESLDADLRAAKAERDDRARRLDETRLRAPVTGRLIAPDLRYAIGRFLAAGSVVAQVEVADPRIAEVQVPESDVKRLVANGEGTIHPWSLAAGGIEGRVVHIAPSAEDGDAGRIVRVQLEFSDPAGRLKSGMTGMAKIDGGWEPTIVVLTRAFARYLFVRAWSWIP